MYVPAGTVQHNYLLMKCFKFSKHEQSHKRFNPYVILADHFIKKIEEFFKRNILSFNQLNFLFSLI